MSSNRYSNILVFETPEGVAREAAERFARYASQAIAEHGLFSVALAGGNTPRRSYELLATTDFMNPIDWSHVHVFFGDERTVPHDHPDSNFRMANEALFTKVPIPSGNIFAINGDGDPIENARTYERELKAFFRDSERPRFDLVLLGLGKDGHTASLFPGTEALHEQESWVVANRIAADSIRLTLTAFSLNSAAYVEFLVTGDDKAPALAAVLEGPLDVERYPAQLIQVENGKLSWLVDVKAASRLSTEAEAN